MRENKEPVVPEKETNLSRRKFLKIVGLAAGAVVIDKLTPRILAETNEFKDAIEVTGQELPKFIHEAIKQNNRKHKEHLVTPDDVVYIVNWQKYIEANNSNIGQKEREIISKDLAYSKDVPEPRVYVVGDSTFADTLQGQSKSEGCSELMQIMLNGVMIHEATHFHGGDEADAYDVQVKYLEEQEQMLKLMLGSGRYSQQFFIYLGGYIRRYKEYLKGIKTGKYQRGASKL